MKATIVIGAALAVLATAQGASAAAQTVAVRDYAIERQDLGAALRRFAIESGVDVAFDPALVRGRKSQGVRGRLGAEAALRRLLEGSGLRLRRTASGYAVARPAADAATARSTAYTQAAASAGQQDSAPRSPAAPAPDAAEAESNDPIVVTGSRVDRAGFEAPTPTTVVGEAELRQGGRSNVAAVLNDLPQFRATSNPTNTAGNTASGTASADLRGIGSSRTLVLLNGHRFVGDGDLNSVPFSLVKRVEVVTGGASAAWGSEAVAGVVNIILDDRLSGLELSGQAGISSRGDGEEYRVGATFGTGFGGGRGHVIAAAEFLDYKGIFTMNARKSVGSAALIANPSYTPTNGQHAFVIAPDVGSSNASLGGLILTGVLAGQTFEPDGTLRPFDYGTLRSSTLMSGGEGLSYNDVAALTAPLKRLSLFGRAGYDLTDDIRVTADIRQSRVWADHPWLPDRNLGGIAISVNNAFLPAAVRDRILAAGQTGFTMGRFNSDYAFRRLDYSRRTLQGTIGLEGRFGDGWRWDAYYSHGEYRVRQELSNARITANFAQAVDSVVSPVTGRPICRIALTDPATNCVPINLFGYGAPSQAATDYVTGTAYNATRTTLDVGAFSIRGEPFSLWAGPISIAVGGEARRERIRTLATDPVSLAKGFAVLNFGPLNGGYSVREAFGEVVVPLLRDVPFFKLLEFNGAARLSDYSSAGSLWSWKLGISDLIHEDLRVRLVRSRDIRAPNIGELYTTAGVNTSTISDPFTGQQAFVQTLTGGNAGLDAEIANTLTVGAVFSPSWAPRLSLAVDYYDIDIKGAITTLGSQSIVTRCFDGNAALCPLITRNAAGTITTIRSVYINLSRFQAKGVDIEASYMLPLDRLAPGLDGSLRFRALANYVDALVNDDGVTRVDSVGTLGFLAGVPRWRGVAGMTYQSDALTLDLRARYVDGGLYNPAQDIANNAISSRTYVDLSFQTKIRSNGRDAFTLFGSVTNLFDRDPPIAPNSVHFDLIGRTFQMGARVKF